MGDEVNEIDQFTQSILVHTKRNRKSRKDNLKNAYLIDENRCLTYQTREWQVQNYEIIQLCGETLRKSRIYKCNKKTYEEMRIIGTNEL